ncbi:MAG: 3-keto-5-aminohexanoate cleavage protein [Amaricoccus sp.]
MRLQACLNGGRTRRDHPAVPLTPAALARDARAVRAAGAESLHFHPRDAAGRESLAAADVAAALEAVRAAVPGMPVGIGTGGWIAPRGPGRMAALRGWTSLPDFVSVNLHEPDADDVIALMRARGIAVEAGLRDAAAARRFVGSRYPRYSLRALVEPSAGSSAEAERAAAEVLAVLEHAGVRLPLLLHGTGDSVWTMVGMAAARGFATRVGLEDGWELPGGAVAAGNAALVAAAARILA